MIIVINAKTDDGKGDNDFDGHHDTIMRGSMIIMIIMTIMMMMMMVELMMAIVVVMIVMIMIMMMIMIDCDLW